MLQRFLMLVALGGVVLSLYAFNIRQTPDPSLIRLSVRATVHAMPTPSPVFVEVTRVVEVTRIVEVVQLITPTPVPQPSDTPVPSPIDTPTPEPPPEPEARAAGVALLGAPIPPEQPRPEGGPAPLVEAASRPGCPASSGNQYSLIPVSGPRADHPDTLHGDLNLGLRGYTPLAAATGLVSINGPVDGDPPQLRGVLLGGDATFTQAYRVRDWDWSCGEHGCQGGELTQVEVSLLGLATSPGQPIGIPSRRAEIFGGGYTALVVYAEDARLTVVYTREDSVANGYAVHFEYLCVDPNLLALYRSANAAGRASLPGLRNGDIVGTAYGNEVAVAVRDRGWFTDPRSAKDWWQSGQ